MKLKGIILFISAFVLVTVGTAIFVAFLSNDIKHESSPENLERYLSNVIKSMSKDKAFTYTVTENTMAENSRLMGKVWCIQIAPAVDTESLAAVNHIVVQYYDSAWTGLLFEDSDEQRKRWKEVGCLNW